MEVVRIRRKSGKVVQDCDVYIGRACYRGGWKLPQSIWHNPFSVNKFGREKSIELYRQYILETPGLMSQLHTLQGKTLGCWCKPLACHGDVLVELVGDLLR